MKKTLFAALALAFVASCSNEEVVEMAQKEAIAFDKTFVNNSTRSVVDPSYNNDNLFRDFTVNGFVNQTQLFNNKTVTAKDVAADAAVTTNAAWEYSGVQYWVPDALYSFCAIAPSTSGGWTNLSSTLNGKPVENSEIIKTTFDFTNDGTTDLLYDEVPCVKGKTTGNSNVSFTFRHLLSKVKFSFENQYNGENATIKVTGIKIINAHKTAKAELTTNATTWGTLADPTLILEFGDATDKEAENDDNHENTAPATGYENGLTYESLNEMLLIPSSQKYEYKVEFTVALYINNALIATYKHTGNNAAKVTFAPAAGYSYDIKAVINPSNINPDPDAKQEPIVFSVTGTETWKTPTTGTNVTF